MTPTKLNEPMQQNYGRFFGPLLVRPMMMGKPMFTIDQMTMMNLMGHLIYGLMMFDEAFNRMDPDRAEQTLNPLFDAPYPLSSNFWNLYGILDLPISDGDPWCTGEILGLEVKTG